MGDLLNVVGLSTGVVLYSLLLAMVVRAPQTPTIQKAIDPVPLAAALLGLAWNICALVIYALPSLGIRGGPLPYVSAIGFSALGFLPAVVVHSVVRTGHDGSHLPIKRALIAVAYGSSAVAALLHLHALWVGEPVPATPGMRLLTYTFVALVFPVVLSTRGQPGARRALWIAALAAFTVSALHLTQLHTGNDPWPVELLGHHASLPLALAILYQDYPFAFADLFLKRALTLVALVIAAFMGIATLDSGSVRGESVLLVGPRELGLVITLWVATALMYPWLHRGISWFVDAIVLKRPDYRALSAAIAKRVQVHERVEPLLDDVCDLLAPALTGEPPRWHAISNPSPREIATIAATVLVADAVATIIVPTCDKPQYTIVSGQLKGGRRLLSGDVSMLELVALTVARRIDVIRLTHERCDRELREQEIAKLATEAELRALQAQINPHFLFNALTTIGYLIQTAPPRAFSTLMRLTSLLRSVLKTEGDFTTLGRELEVVEAYLDIERARFEDRLQVCIEVPAGVRAARVPPLLLQPLVENAVKHGVAPQRDGARVTVSASVGARAGDDYELSVVVQDTGAGASERALEWGRQRGVGLRNIERRLACQYGTRASLVIHSLPGRGTTVEIRLPVPVWMDEPVAKVGA